MDAPHQNGGAGTGQTGDEDMARACLSGLWLRYNFLECSHEISNSIPTTTGSYWHGIMHRREPDAGNATYWFRRVGRHRVFPLLHDAVGAIIADTNSVEARALKGQREWNPFAFIDLCERSRGRGDEGEKLCLEIQRIEWELLFDFCYRGAREA